MNVAAQWRSPEADADTPVLEVEHLTVEVASEHGWARVVDDVSFSIAPGETLGLVGESGSGKTMTSLATIGLIPVPHGRLANGTVTLDGVEISALSSRQMQDIRGQQISMIFQEPMTSLNPAYRIGEQIAETVRRHLGLGRRDAWQRAVEMLDTVGIPNAAERARSYPHEFSGGMRQRAMIAIALSCEPKLLIADEPTTALDVTIQAQVLDLLREMRAEFDMSILFITHDLGVVAESCDRVAVMYAGQLVEQAEAADLFERPQHPYTSGLLRAMPQLVESDTGVHVVPGLPPSPWDLADGCLFSPRCAFSEPACTSDVIEIETSESGRRVRCRRADELDLEGCRG